MTTGGDIELVCAALASIASGVGAVTVGTETYTPRGFNPPPAKLDTADLPAAWAFTGQASYDNGSDWVTETRQYAVQCAVLPLGQGTPAEREQRVRPILNALRAAIWARPHLGVSGVQRAVITGDSGVVILPEYDGAFYGFELRLAVTVNVARSYAAGE